MVDWSEKPKEFLENLSNFIGNKDNDEISQYLKGTGGFISLGFGIAKLIQEYKKSLLTDYERSIGDLFSFLFCFTSNYLREIWLKQGYSGEKDPSFFKTSNLKKELCDFVLSYKRRLQTPMSYPKLDSPWLPVHPIIQQFKQEITIILSSINNNSNEFKNIKKEFEKIV